ncbi:MAG: hypothetical protein PVG39_04230 [Desulfobacteraceae bacterium]|jgi:hypothetical protein
MMTNDNPMTDQPDISALSGKIRQIYSSNPSLSGDHIEKFLKDSFRDFSYDQKIKCLEALIDEFSEDASCSDNDVNIDPEILTRIFSFLLGKKVSLADLQSTELLQRLADSLNTIFDMLNRLIGVINMTFLGQHGGIETIRQVIGFHLEGENQSNSLESYLGQINKAFLISQEAFKISAEKKVREILMELAPEKISESLDSGFTFGKSRKAKSFDQYAYRYETFKEWYDSGRFMEEFLREFENNCQRLFSE